MWGSGGLSLCILRLGTTWRWVVRFMLRPLCRRGKTQYPFSMRLFGPFGGLVALEVKTFLQLVNGNISIVVVLGIVSSFRNVLFRLLFSFSFYFIFFLFFLLYLFWKKCNLCLPFWFNSVFNKKWDFYNSIFCSLPIRWFCSTWVSRLYSGAHTSRERAVSLKMISQALIVSETCGNLVSVQLFSIVRGTVCSSTFLIGFVGHAAWQFLHRVTSGERQNTLKSHFCRQPFDPISYLRVGLVAKPLKCPIQLDHSMLSTRK